MKQEFNVTMKFTRKSVINLLLGPENPFNEDDYKMYTDNQIIQEAGKEGYITNVNPEKIYCFTDEGTIVEQKRLNRWINSEKKI